jgi:membrane protein DedA with SNARE-associated domain
MLTQYTETLLAFIRDNYSNVPLPWFTLFGSFIEEVISPIPSPLILTLAGSLTAAQERGTLYLLLIAITGSVGKTYASYLIYLLADKGEDFILNKIGRFLGVTHKSIENVGKHLNKGYRDEVVLIFLRAFPIIPTIPVSVACGLIKINLKTFLATTFIGTIFRNLFYMILGYSGINATENVAIKYEDYEILVYVVIALSVVVFTGYLYFKNSKKEETVEER